MENIKSIVKKNLKLYRKNRKLTQQDVAYYIVSVCRGRLMAFLFTSSLCVLVFLDIKK